MNRVPNCVYMRLNQQQLLFKRSVINQILQALFLKFAGILKDLTCVVFIKNDYSYGFLLNF